MMMTMMMIMMMIMMMMIMMMILSMHCCKLRSTQMQKYLCPSRFDISNVKNWKKIYILSVEI